MSLQAPQRSSPVGAAAPLPPAPKASSPTGAGPANSAPRRVNLGVQGETPLKHAEFRRESPPARLARATPDRFGRAASKSALLSTPQREEAADRRSHHAAALSANVEASLSILAETAAGMASDDPFSSPNLKTNVETLPTRPKTSRHVPHPSPSQFSDYVDPSPSKGGKERPVRILRLDGDEPVEDPSESSTGEGDSDTAAAQGGQRSDANGARSRRRCKKRNRRRNRRKKQQQSTGGKDAESSDDAEVDNDEQDNRGNADKKRNGGDQAELDDPPLRRRSSTRRIAASADYVLVSEEDANSGEEDSDDDADASGDDEDALAAADTVRDMLSDEDDVDLADPPLRRLSSTRRIAATADYVLVSADNADADVDVDVNGDDAPNPARHDGNSDNNRAAIGDENLGDDEDMEDPPLRRLSSTRRIAATADWALESDTSVTTSSTSSAGDLESDDEEENADDDKDVTSASLSDGNDDSTGAGVAALDESTDATGEGVEIPDPGVESEDVDEAYIARQVRRAEVALAGTSYDSDGTDSHPDVIMDTELSSVESRSQVSGTTSDDEINDSDGADATDTASASDDDDESSQSSERDAGRQRMGDAGNRHLRELSPRQEEGGEEDEQPTDVDDARAGWHHESDVDRTEDENGGVRRAREYEGDELDDIGIDVAALTTTGMLRQPVPGGPATDIIDDDDEDDDEDAEDEDLAARGEESGTLDPDRAGIGADDRIVREGSVRATVGQLVRDRSAVAGPRDPATSSQAQDAERHDLWVSSPERRDLQQSHWIPPASSAPDSYDLRVDVEDDGLSAASSEISSVHAGEEFDSGVPAPSGTGSSPPGDAGNIGRRALGQSIDRTGYTSTSSAGDLSDKEDSGLDGEEQELLFGSGVEQDEAAAAIRMFGLVLAL